MDHVDGTGKNENVKCFLDKKKNCILRNIIYESQEKYIFILRYCSYFHYNKTFQY